MGKRKTRKSGRRAAEHEEGRLLEMLRAVLSEAEIRRVLACALLSLDDACRERLGARLGPETGDVVHEVLSAHASDGGAKSPAPGARKIRETWEALWDRWQAQFGEAEGEDGTYIIQDYDWEPPYLDTAGLFMNLEPIAAEMRVLVPRVLQEDLAPDLDIAAAIVEGVLAMEHGLPDWMDRSEDGGLGPEVTTLTLEWEWNRCRGAGESAFALIDRLLRMEEESSALVFDHSRVASFVGHLDEADQRAILTGMVTHREEDRWADALDSTHSEWFAIHQQLARRWDRAWFRDESRRRISENWTLALPLVTEARRQKRYDEAQVLIDAALRAMLRLGPNETWNPSSMLIACHPSSYRFAHRDRELSQLLTAWQKVARARDQDEAAAALDVQVAVGRDLERGDEVLAALRQVPSPRFDTVRARLLGSWREWVIEATLERIYGEEEPAGAAWVGALVDAAWAGRRAAPSFRRTVTEWLDQIGADPATLERSRAALRVLTLDLDAAVPPERRLRRRAPALRGALELDGGRRSRELLERWRGRAMARLELGGLLSKVIAFWRARASAMVPDPAEHGGSEYDACARWLAAVKELDESAYGQILEDWAVRHGRRRNLWRDLAARGITR